MSIANFILRIIIVGFAFLSAGSLTEIIIDLEKKCARDTKTGIIDIGAWNRHLMRAPSKNGSYPVKH